jgi:hypothetical protein
VGKVAAPRFSRSYRRLCQVAALAGSERLRHVVDGLVAVVMVYDDGPWKGPADWISAAKNSFDLSLGEAEVQEAISRAIKDGRIIHDARSQTFDLSRAARTATENRIDEGESLERTVQASWLAEVESLTADIPSDSLWHCLVAYTADAFLRHGYEAVTLLQGESEQNPDEAGFESTASLLRKSLAAAGISAERYEHVSAAIAVFFDGRSPERVKYITELVDSTFNFMALGVDRETRSLLAEHLPQLSIFVDTNVILGLLGAHEAPLAAASADFFRIVQGQKFPFRIYCHERTIQELERTIEGIGYKLRQRQWTPQLSRAALSVPYAISSIEVRFHQLNADTPTSPDIFLSKYESLPALLFEHGLKIYRDNSSAGSQEELRSRGELIAEYDAFASENLPPKRKRKYEALDHDIRLWLAARGRRIAKGKGPLFAGAMVLSADYLFRRFDRDILARGAYGTGGRIVFTPDAMLQALRPFMASTEDYDATFSRLFATAEFRGVSTGEADTISRVLGYLATYSDLREETAVKMLTNTILMTRLRDVSENSDEFREVIDQALIDENESLLQLRDELRESERNSREQTAGWAQGLSTDILALEKAIRESGLQTQPDKLEEINSLISRMHSKGSDMAAAAGVQIEMTGGRIFIAQGGNVNEGAGGHYENRQSQIAAQGPNAQAQDIQQFVGVQAESISIVPGLSGELETLRAEVLRVATTSDDYQAVAEIQAAKEAADRGDGGGVAQHLRGAGRRALAVGLGVGVPVAIAAIKQSLGLGN